MKERKMKWKRCLIFVKPRCRDALCFLLFTFRWLGDSTRLYKSACPSVHRRVGRSVGRFCIMLLFGWRKIGQNYNFWAKQLFTIYATAPCPRFCPCLSQNFPCPPAKDKTWVWYPALFGKTKRNEKRLNRYWLTWYMGLIPDNSTMRKYRILPRIATGLEKENLF